MITLIKTNPNNKDFIKLVKDLDTYLALKDGDEHDFYDQFNKSEGINHVIMAYENGFPAGCGAIKTYDKKTMEVKRMYTIPEYRGKGIASKILKALELWASELSFHRCILETGKRQTEAVALYHKTGYKTIPNYAPYEGIDNSICFEKILILEEL
ncbi:GNAT family N-acetyltransferase [Zhouia spongiae]|uniref:GNAT family N-acetyltransferase n=1 Tax=Zhouia spongiae TaxID=2202721 RepID=A0ABY3YKQ8_9FLAO|nr:GNAT family N-acetyltransferase [Zhouia spongiae]UNY98273.1 GNAT family N-acetyltransferase [Zhouia spongiae]